MNTTKISIVTNDKQSKLKQIEELRYGDAFLYGGLMYLLSDYTQDDGLVFAVNLGNGSITTFSPNTKVELIPNVEIRWSR